MLLATGLSDLHGINNFHSNNHRGHHSYRITKQQERKVWKMEDNRTRRQRYAAPYTTAAMDSSLVYPDDSMLYAPSTSFAPMPSHPVHVPEDYLSYGSQLDPSHSYYQAPHQPYIPHSNSYYPATTPNTQQQQQWLHQTHVSPSHYSHGHGHGHNNAQPYQDSTPSSDLDPDFDMDLDVDDIDLPTSNHHHNLSPSPSASGSAGPSRTTSSSTSSSKQDTKDLTLYGTPSPTHPGTWRCAYPSCTSPSLFRRGCDLRKHYNRHRKHLFCRHDGCPQANPAIPGAGFSSKKDRDRHEAKHNPGIRCEWASEGCTRVFSRVDNMKDHVRRIHKVV